MRFSLFQKYSFVFVLLLCFVFIKPALAQQKTTKKVAAITVNLKVTDGKDNPIAKAQIVIGEGVKYTETDKNGSTTFTALPSDFVKISYPGYEKAYTTVADILINKNVKLAQSKLFMTSDDIVPLPFNEYRKRNLTGSVNVLTESHLDKYPSSDIRNAFKGLVPGLEVIERNGATGISPEEKLGVFGVSEKVAMYMRGHNPMVMIDNVPTELTEMQLEPQEIESVSIIKDIAEKAMYGPIASDGIIFIKTKRGSRNDRTLNIKIEDGVGVVDRFPNWVTGADYARLNNIARTNSGLTPLYSAADISAYGLNNPYDMYHPSVNYRDLIFQNTKSFKRASLTSQGGTDAVKYFANLSYSGDGDIYKLGPKSNYNRINARSNLDIKINDRLKVAFDLFAGLSLRQSPNYGYSPNYGSDASSDATMDILEFNRVIDNITTNSPIAFPIYAKNDPSLKSPWFGVTPVYPINPIGRLTKDGYYTEIGRTGKVSATFEYDLSNVLEGLKSKTFIGLDANYLLRIGKAEDYIAYNVTPSHTASGADTILLTKSHDGVDMPGQANLHDFYYQRLAVYENLNYSKSFGNNDLQTSLTYSLYKLTRNGIEEPTRQQNLTWTGLYSVKDKYYLQGVLNYGGSSTFAKGKRYDIFPSIGAGWVASEENFMSGVKFINYLKFHAEAGILGSESFLNPYLYRDRWDGNSLGPAFGPYSTNPWFGSTQDNQVYRTGLGLIGNPNLTWEKRREVSIGFDALMLNQKLSLEMSYYNNVSDGQIVQLINSIPSVSGFSQAQPWYNYNKTRYFGLETGLQFTDKSNNFSYSFGATATIQNSKVMKFDEPDYRDKYLSRVGKPVDAFFGQTYIGKFKTDNEALAVPQIFDAVLHQGDLKYVDMNNDGLVDDNDQTMIGHTTPRLFYSLNARVAFKNFEITVIGTGRALYDIPLTNKYFMNGWGDNNYSTFVRDNLNGAYPKLTYYKVNNNFVNSNFWLVKGGYFKIQNVELAYNIPSNKLQIIKARGVRLFVRGANLLTISKIKDVDPESINSGVDSYPLFKSFTGGIKITF